MTCGNLNLLTFQQGKTTMTHTEIMAQLAEGKLSRADAEKLIRQQQPKRRRLPPLITILLGSVCAAVGIGLGIHTWSFASSARETEGTVIRLVRTGTRGAIAPVVRYEVNGK